MREYLNPDQLTSILAFARSKPAAEEYRFWSTRECALAQCGRHLFPEHANVYGGSDMLGYWEDDFSNCRDFHLPDGHSFATAADPNLGSEAWTWGQFADRFEAAMKEVAYA